MGCHGRSDLLLGFSGVDQPEGLAEEIDLRWVGFWVIGGFWVDFVSCAYQSLILVGENENHSAVFGFGNDDPMIFLDVIFG